MPRSPAPLTSSDPEPDLGTVVRDKFGRLWRRTEQLHIESTYWLEYPGYGGDPESWIKVAGNWGPVEVVSRA